MCDGNGLSWQQRVAWTHEPVVDGVSCLFLAMLVQVSVRNRSKWWQVMGNNIIITISDKVTAGIHSIQDVLFCRSKFVVSNIVYKT